MCHIRSTAGGVVSSNVSASDAQGLQARITGDTAAFRAGLAVKHFLFLGARLSGLIPLSIELGTLKTVKARFWPRLSGHSPHNPLNCSLFALKRTGVIQRKAQLKTATVFQNRSKSPYHLSFSDLRCPQVCIQYSGSQLHHIGVGFWAHLTPY